MIELEPASWVIDHPSTLSSFVFDYVSELIGWIYWVGMATSQSPRIGPDGLVLGSGGRIKEEKRLSGSRFNNTNTLAFCNVL